MASWHALRRTGLDLGGYGEVFLLVDNWAALARELPDLEAEIAELAARGLHYGVHLVLAGNRWADLRPSLRENLGGRLELRLNDPLESELGRAAAAALPDLSGRGLTQSGLQFQVALPGEPAAILARALPARDGAVAPPLRLLPELLGEAALPMPGPEPAAGEPATGQGLPFAVEEHRWSWRGSTCSGNRRTCSCSGTPPAASRACCGSSLAAWPPATHPTRSRCWSSTCAEACST